MPDLRVAIVHDWFYNYAGSERVVEQILHLFPQADLFALFDFLPASERGFIGNKPVRTSFIQGLPLARRNHRWYLPLMPKAVESLDVSSYDLVLSSSHAVAKGVKTRSGQVHVSYVHTPLRYAWDLQSDYFPGLKGALVAPAMRLIRRWDRGAAKRPSVMIANSENVRQRILRHYGREAVVVYPPADVESFVPAVRRENFYLAVSRFVPYKHNEIIFQAFSQLGLPLVVIGDGPQAGWLSRLAGPTVKLLGFQPNSVVRDHMSRCKAFVFAANEDFGLTPVEAQAAGAPVIAYRAGGALETVIEGKTGVFFDAQTVPSLRAAVMAFETSGATFSPEDLAASARRFGIARFRADYMEAVDKAWRSVKGRGLDRWTRDA